LTYLILESNGRYYTAWKSCKKKISEHDCGYVKIKKAKTVTHTVLTT